VTPRRAVIVDDERLARRELAYLLQSHPEVEVVGEAGSVKEAAKVVESLRPDLLFLDIQMPRESGFDLFERTAITAEVIFVTAHDDKAVMDQASFVAALTDSMRLPGFDTIQEWKVLHENGDTVVVGGYMTQMCCDTTARQAFRSLACG